MNFSRDEKQPVADVEQRESINQDSPQNDLKKPEGDYSGAIAKSDPAELKLVRKLDIWIMVRRAN